jgi:5-methylcytosine-specific restriction endonuclease McrA
MELALAVLFAAAESEGSSSGNGAIVLLFGACWGTWFLRRRRNLGRFSAFLVSLFLWPLFLIWALSRAVSARRSSERGGGYAHFCDACDARVPESADVCHSCGADFRTDNSGASETKASAGPPIRKKYEKQSIPSGLRAKVLVRDNFTCRWCLRGREELEALGLTLHVDHIKPESRGGKMGLSNLQVLCSECNLGKGNRYSV